MTQSEEQSATDKTALGTGARGDLAHPKKDAVGKVDATPPVVDVVPTEPPAEPVEGEQA